MFLEIVVAKPRDLDDKVAWFLEKKQYQKCLEAIEGKEHLLTRHDPLQVGEKVWFRSYSPHFFFFLSFSFFLTLSWWKSMVFLV